MNRKRLFATGLVVLTLALGSSVGALATTNISSTTESAVQTQTQKQNKTQLTDAQRTAIENARKSGLKEAAAALVSNGTLTQAEADTLLANMDKVYDKAIDKDNKMQGKENGVFKNLTDAQKESLKTESKSVYEDSLAKLVLDKTITQAQADQLKKAEGQKTKLSLTDAQRKAVQEARINSMKTAAANLVSKGTLTQAVADTITSQPVKQNADKDEQKGKGMFANLTDTQIKAVQDATSASFKNALTGLVSKGTITQTIADQIQNMKMGFGHHGMKNGQRNMDSPALNSSAATSVATN